MFKASVNRTVLSGFRYTLEYYDGNLPGSASLEFKKAIIMPGLQYMQPSLKDNDTAAEIASFYPMGLDQNVEPLRRHFGQGIGHELLETMIMHARPNAKAVYVTTHSINMNRLLDRHGFLECMLIRGYFSRLI